MLLQKQVENMVRLFMVEPCSYSHVTVFPTQSHFMFESCIQHVLSQWSFSETVLSQTLCDRQGRIYISVQAYVSFGKTAIPVVLLESLEESSRMDRTDIIYLLASLIEEVELELEALRNDGLHIADVADLVSHWEN